MTYSWATSAPATSPVLVMVAVTVATVSKRSEGPPGARGPDAGPAVAVESIVMSAYSKVVYATRVSLSPLSLSL